MKRISAPARLIIAMLASGALLMGLVGTLPASADTRVTASEGVKVTTSALNLRRGPGLSYSVVKVLARGTRVTLAGKSARGFTQILSGSSRGWVSSRYLATTTGLPAIVGSRTATANLNARVTPVATSKIAAVINKGTRLSLTGATQNGRSQVLYAGAARWVVTKYLTTRKPANPPKPTYGVEKGLSANSIVVHRAAIKMWPTITTYYGYRNDPSSDHYKGDALDLMIPNYKTAAGKAMGYKVANWAVVNQPRLKIQYIIWNQHIWNVSRAREGWRPMANRGSDSANHKNHVHISVQ